MVLRLAHYIKTGLFLALPTIGFFVLFLAFTIKTLFTTRLKFSKLLAQMGQIGVGSLVIVILTGTFTGMVFALQTYIGFQRVGGEQFIGSVVALGLIRELGPVLTGLMVTGWAGSAIRQKLAPCALPNRLTL